jgi:N-acetylglucosaminyldiphosphoundecaprenol N-acetyl-beta-D-mannosaminyltransferase
MTHPGETRSILGIPVHAFPTYADAADYVRRRLTAGLRTFCVALNPEKLYRAQREAKLRSVLMSADVRLCDGVGVSIASRVLTRLPLPRCTGIDLFVELVALASREEWSIYLLGASPEVNARAQGELKRRFPFLRVAGARDGFFSNSAEVVKDINRSRADMLFAAMGSPRQEVWIAEHRPMLHPRFCMGVGGTLDVVAGAVKRAPAVFRKTGTEWLFRLASNPKRARRQVALPLFAWDVLKAALERGAATPVPAPDPRRGYGSE